MPDISKTYDPKQVEQRWYQTWLDRGAFAGRCEPNLEAYSIVIPPPNVTGMLTMGHVLNNTIQDILVRRARLEGKCVLWVPGTDHAGIATQTRVERELRKEGLNRRDLGRERFLKKVWEWREEHGGIILKQLRRLGCSCDWDRTAFTLEKRYARAVLAAFVKLYERGYIFRGKRMVNWCPASLTALSDEEVIMAPQQGFLYRMRYEIVEHPGEYLEISTTRPETLMGDTGVAVHPDDPRYAHYVGMRCWRPFPRAEIPIIADRAVDREFGTGVLKVTPAHDKLDFEIGKRHGLSVIEVFNPDGTLNEFAGQGFVGMDRFVARERAVEKLQELGLFVEQESYENNVGFSERANVPVEPRISDQWWLRYPKIKEAKRAVTEKLIRFWPQRWEKVYLHWLDNIQDWCVSRQLWWGHRIPVWYPKGSDRLDPATFHVSIDGPADPENWDQEEDVLDTWASSWLWPFATMGWPDEAKMEENDLDFFYPTSDLVTAPDIIFFWVARMIVAGLEFRGAPIEELDDEEIGRRIPFRNVYFTGLIRDARGRKMSKSLGNSPDPLDLIERYGADGLRFGIMSIAPTGQDILFSHCRVKIGRNLCNKLWNVSRFRQVSGPMFDNSDLHSILERMDPVKFDAFDYWIVARLCGAVGDVARSFEEYEMNQFTQVIYGFFWSDFCDWYIEASKTKLQDATRRDNVLAIQDLVIRQVLLLLHPITPHITEELWHMLAYGNADELIQEVVIETNEQLIQALEEQGISLDPVTVDQVGMLAEFVRGARSLKAAHNLAGRRDATFYFVAEKANRHLIDSHRETIKRLVGASVVDAREEAVEGAPAEVLELATIYLDLSRGVDVTVERERLSRELEISNKGVEAGEAKLGNPNFVSRAPIEVVEGVRNQLAARKVKRDEIERLLAALPDA